MLYSLKKTYYAVPIASCSDEIQQGAMMFNIPPLAHTQKLETNGSATLTLLYPLTELWSLVGASTDLVNIGNYPANNMSV